MNGTGKREESLFSAAMELPTPEARAAFLREACSGDDQLRQRVQALLEAAQPTNDFLEHAPGAPAFLPASPAPGPTISLTVPIAEKAGDRIGHYKLLEQIGEGGCGVVYMAEQTEPIRRRVAFKVIKLGMDTKQVVARFEAERQALALMDHPNIAKVLDAGATDTGRPYFVMELVKGIKITDFCGQNHLATKERLGLFMQVCHAVQHAHQKGIIHRDIKPSNILVTLHDGVPVPKVIDFGIAKATQQPLTDKTMFTSLQQFIGTPAYMSPEQAELSGLDINTRTDIYSLGVLLYELLTGKPPFEPDTLLKAGLDEMRRIIRETEPPKPSTKLATTLAANPQSAVRTPQLKEVRGDLDWIVMKCLEKDRRRRYETANGLAQDIERHLNSEPVTAGAPGAAYRMSKFIRRHRFGLATATTLVLLLAAGVVVSTWQMLRAKRAERQAQTVATFLEDMLKSVSPQQAKGRDTTLMREILDGAAARVDSELKDQPRIEIWLRDVLGEVYYNLGQYAMAEPILREVLTAQRKLLGVAHPKVAASLTKLASVLRCRGKLGEAETLQREALAMRKKQLGNEHLEVAESLAELGQILLYQSKPGEAETLHREALAMRKKLLGNEHPTVAESLADLSMALVFQGKHAEAEAMSRQALAIGRKSFGSEDLKIADCLNPLGLILLEQEGKAAEAESVFREELAITRKLLDNDHPDTVVSIKALLEALLVQRKYLEAEQLLNELVTPVKPGQPESARMLRERANFFARRGQWKKATADIARAIELEPTNHLYYHNLAPLLVAAGDLDDYRRLCQQVVARFGGTEDAAISELMAKACLILPSPGVDLAAVGKMADTAVNGDQKHRFLAYFQFTKGLAEYRQGRFASAAEWMQKVLAGREQVERDPRRDVWTYMVLAMAQHQLGQRDEAGKTLATGTDLASKELPKLDSGDLGAYGEDCIIADALMREARALVESK
jgi:eukaryotic-like serine/threonine-protein kinase